MTRNRFAGEPLEDDDEAIADALGEVSIPALLCSLVHMTGDPSWVRGEIQPNVGMSLDIQGGMSEEDMAEVRRRALPAIAAYRDGGCIPVELSQDLLREMMGFLGRRPVEGRLAGLLLDDLQFDGGDSGQITWGDEVSEVQRAASLVVVIGCGMSGILAGIRLKQAGLPFTIIDQNGGPGGTWWENRYPGARVDVGSHQYCYSFEPAAFWSEYYCQQPELCAYFGAIAEKFELLPHCRFGTAVTELEWREGESMWRVGARDADGVESILEARFVVSAVGSLNLPRLPAIPGMDTFRGPAFHSARWPEDLDIEGTRFALVGAGASGFQLGPAIADEVEQLTIFQRTAQWILPNRLYHTPVPDGDAWALRHLPFYGRWYRFVMTFAGIAAGMEMYRIDPEYEDPTHQSINALNAKRAVGLVASIRSIVGDDPDLLEKVVPDYPATGKRILQDDGTWLRTLQRPNVELVRTGIERVVPDGIVTADGHHYPADVICYATGFRHNEFLASMRVTGRNGTSLHDQWGEEPTAYLGITMPNFPNLFCIYGPGTNLAFGASLFYHSEFQVHYALEAMRETLASGARWSEVRPEAHDDYADRYQEEIGQLVWSHPAITHSHYKNSKGKVFTLSPWPLDQYWEWTRHMDRQHYRFGGSTVEGDLTRW
ncbi:MAG TPA: NAD(P)/FAD-dependent oxidoreductase [Acidimicrobiales bacterium]|nr:NAD(P)/FAD-dependent oxidoreductase [Acidimicrobiales bacterium]